MSRAYDQYREMIDAGRHMDAAALAEQHYMAGNPGNPFWLIRRASARTGRKGVPPGGKRARCFSFKARDRPACSALCAN